MLTIAEVAERTGLSPHTLRYYERAGLLDPPERGGNGHRRYSEQDLSMLGILSRLRATGMSIADTRRYAQLCREGEATYDTRRELLEEHRRKVLERIAALHEDLTTIEYKIKLYAGADRNLTGP
ncbi:MerR family transcriptional regulator [Dactylosporangium sp. AC04546]|uniref:MerR family transcriptional regulator n=1 Tax=Dactylosporangium sp. AC04546 TaxID=2862460 RepID=UPI001EDFFFB4|nr:MerR family transcriptional regulator [Dactylosporangium sp. AC04546]WVK85753.1 MerR family transcriptional regulator [Dactylosporangium sp. AC04546]